MMVRHIIRTTFVLLLTLVFVQTLKDSGGVQAKKVKDIETEHSLSQRVDKKDNNRKKKGEGKTKKMRIKPRQGKTEHVQKRLKSVKNGTNRRNPKKQKKKKSTKNSKKKKSTKKKKKLKRKKRRKGISTSGITFEKVRHNHEGRLATVDEVIANFEQVKGLLEKWTIARLDGGKLTGHGYGLTVEKGDFSNVGMGEKIIVIETQSTKAVPESSEATCPSCPICPTPVSQVTCPNPVSEATCPSCPACPTPGSEVTCQSCPDPEPCPTNEPVSFTALPTVTNTTSSTIEESVLTIKENGQEIKQKITFNRATGILSIDVPPHITILGQNFTRSTLLYHAKSNTMMIKTNSTCMLSDIPDYINATGMQEYFHQLKEGTVVWNNDEKEIIYNMKMIKHIVGPEERKKLLPDMGDLCTNEIITKTETKKINELQYKEFVNGRIIFNKQEQIHRKKRSACESQEACTEAGANSCSYFGTAWPNPGTGKRISFHSVSANAFCVTCCVENDDRCNCTEQFPDICACSIIKDKKALQTCRLHKNGHFTIRFQYSKQVVGIQSLTYNRKMKEIFIKIDVPSHGSKEEIKVLMHSRPNGMWHGKLKTKAISVGSGSWRRNNPKSGTKYKIHELVHSVIQVSCCMGTYTSTYCNCQDIVDKTSFERCRPVTDMMVIIGGAHGASVYNLYERFVRDKSSSGFQLKSLNPSTFQETTMGGIGAWIDNKLIACREDGCFMAAPWFGPWNKLSTTILTDSLKFDGASAKYKSGPTGNEPGETWWIIGGDHLGTRTQEWNSVQGANPWSPPVLPLKMNTPCMVAISDRDIFVTAIPQKGQVTTNKAWIFSRDYINNGGWRPIPSLLEKRSGAACGFLPKNPFNRFGWIVVAGGRNYRKDKSSTEYLDVADCVANNWSCKWVKGPELPNKMYGASMVTFEREYLVLTGNHTDILAIDSHLKTWKVVGKTSQPRYDAVALTIPI